AIGPRNPPWHGGDERSDRTAMKTVSLGAPRSSTVKFRMPTRDNLVPIRVDIEVDGQRYRDAFTWNPRGTVPPFLMFWSFRQVHRFLMFRPFLRRADPDSEVITFAKRTAKELKLPATFVPQILQSIQGQLAEFRSYEGQEMQVKEKIMP
uniref:Uncharacterized protein n=1 Tax=Aegilops tauschii subsp. strangulata TaxID=200361 RepID=A0A452XXR4_AEGTS